MTSRQPEDPLDAGLALGESFERFGVPYALGGALAFSVWGIPRATVDVDVNIFVVDDLLPRVIEALRSLGIEAELEQVRRDSAARGMFVVRWDLYRIDIFTPSIDFSWEAARTRRSHEIEGRPAWFLSPEALAVFKLLFFRAKDVIDLERLVAIQGAKLDQGYVRRWIVEMMGEDDDRVGRWDRIVADFGKLPP